MTSRTPGALASALAFTAAVAAASLAWGTQRSPDGFGRSLEVAAPAPGPDAAEWPASGHEVLLEEAGIRLELPKNTRIHRKTIEKSVEIARIQAQSGSASFWVSFYAFDDGILGAAYRRAAEGPIPDALRIVLFGDAFPALRTRFPRPGGEVLRFDLRGRPGARRRTIFVAIPANGAGLMTVTVDYSLAPQTAAEIVRFHERVGFRTPEA